ncbi:addiction module toxin RelE, partial [Salmonella enterica subsp. enterica serovar Derby]
IESPDKGESSQKTGGLRKGRRATGNQGKSGRARGREGRATAEGRERGRAYPKSTKDSLTDAEKAARKTRTQQRKDE